MRRGLLALCAILGGCAIQTARMYEGPPLPAAQEVVLGTQSGTLRIAKVDGVRTGLRRGSGVDYQQELGFTVRLRPGMHTFHVIRETTNMLPIEQEMWFVGEPGGTYRVRARFVGYSLDFWVEDVKTGGRVGGPAR